MQDVPGVFHWGPPSDQVLQCKITHPREQKKYHNWAQRPGLPCSETNAGEGSCTALGLVHQGRRRSSIIMTSQTMHSFFFAPICLMRKCINPSLPSVNTGCIGTRVGPLPWLLTNKSAKDHQMRRGKEGTLNPIHLTEATEREHKMERTISPTKDFHCSFSWQQNAKKQQLN